LGRRVLQASRRLAADTELKEDVVLPSGARIGGQIVLDGGTPQPRYVEAIPEGLKPLDNQDTPGGVVVPVAPDGRFLLRELPAGRWRLRALPYFHWVTVETGTLDVALPAK